MKGKTLSGSQQADRHLYTFGDSHQDIQPFSQKQHLRRHGGQIAYCPYMLTYVLYLCVRAEVSFKPLTLSQVWELDADSLFISQMSSPRDGFYELC